MLIKGKVLTCELDHPKHIEGGKRDAVFFHGAFFHERLISTFDDPEPRTILRIETYGLCEEHKMFLTDLLVRQGVIGGLHLKLVRILK